ncbi:unnamed protein product, partial [Meganyctiphanes norvegica]
MKTKLISGIKMICYTRISLLAGLCIALFSAQGYYTNGIKQGKETWGYVSVRDGAHMFFWLYYTTADVDYKTRPLLIWLQGGPGASSTGIGNFLEIGPQDTLLNNRTNAWNEHVNVLFIDNPVGTGFSYVDDPKNLANNNTVIANDLVEFMKGFLLKVPEFENVPLFIFAESYGGKMAVRFAQTLNKAVISKKIKCQVAGVAMGDSWISPVDAVASWGPYLYHTSLVDSIGLSQISAKASQVEAAVKSGAMKNATKLWSETESVIEKVTNGVNFYNILTHDGLSSTTSNQINRIKRFSKPYLGSLYQRHVGILQAELDKLMNGPVRDKLKSTININLASQKQILSERMMHDFLNPTFMIALKELDTLYLNNPNAK